MKQIIIVIFILGVISSSILAQTRDSLTIQDAILQVVRNHPLVRQASATVDASLARVEQSRSGYYPTSDIDLTYARLHPVGEVTFPGLGIFQMFPEDNYDEHISLRQTIYDFGKRSASVEINEWNVESNSKRVDLLRADLAYRTAQSFYTILFLRQDLVVKSQQIDALNDHLLVTQKKAQSGVATDFDVLTTEVRIAAEQNRRADVQNALQKEEATFRRLLGAGPDAPVKLLGSFDAEPLALNTDSLLLLARDRRLEILQSRDQEQMAEAERKAASVGDRPELKVDLAYGLKNGLFPDIDVLRGNWVAAVEANIPIFNGFKTRHQEEEAQAKVLAAREQTRNTVHQVEMEVQQAVSELRTSAEKIETTTLQIEQATQALTMANVRYESGVITNLDLIDAQTALAEAELTHLDALRNYVISRFALEKAIGENLIPVR